jgi:predicted nucleic acid-binding protein
MTYLLDVSALLALLLENHTMHARVSAWVKGKKVAVCPITELGFIRVATSLIDVHVGLDAPR